MRCAPLCCCILPLAKTPTPKQSSKTPAVSPTKTGSTRTPPLAADTYSTPVPKTRATKGTRTTAAATTTTTTTLATTTTITTTTTAAATTTTAKTTTSPPPPTTTTPTLKPYEDSPCHPNVCQHGGTCHEFDNGHNYACICPVGYAGTHCQGM